MRRPRSIQSENSYTSIEAFKSSTISSGSHSISIDGHKIDFYLVDRGSDTTLAVFHGALSEKHKTLPVFEGKGLADRSGCNLISLSDPSLSLGDIDIAWYQGNRWLGDANPYIQTILRHLTRKIDSTRTILFGSSGGGFAAARAAPGIKDSVVLAVNPRLDLAAKPNSEMNNYLNVCHAAHSRTPMHRIRKEFVIESVSDLYAHRESAPLFLYQNVGDSVYLRHQAIPFLKHTRAGNVFSRFDYDADGHGAPARGKIDGMIRTLATVQTIERAAQEQRFTKIY